MSLGESLLAPQPLAAMIGGGFVALGWIFTHWLTLRRDRALRAERVRDVQGALHAEIQVYTETLESQVLPLYGAQIEGQILTQPDFFPVIPTEKNDRIFSAIVDEIHILPFKVVRPVVEYYYQLAVIADMAADLRQVKVAEIGAHRAARMYRHYIEMKIEAIELGNDAKAFLAAYLYDGNRAVDELLEGKEKARHAQAKAGLESWIAAEKLKSGAQGSIRADRNPATGRSGRS